MQIQYPLSIFRFRCNFQSHKHIYNIQKSLTYSDAFLRFRCVFQIQRQFSDSDEISESCAMFSFRRNIQIQPIHPLLSCLSSSARGLWTGRGARGRRGRLAPSRVGRGGGCAWGPVRTPNPPTAAIGVRGCTTRPSRVTTCLVQVRGYLGPISLSV
jgi:hypothetical protein